MKLKLNFRVVLCVLGLLVSCFAHAQQNAAPPPSAPAQSSASELEKLVAPIALYSDPLIATVLPAAVYPLEIVQAARFVKDTNNLAKLDDQPWDENVKAVARIPALIQKLDAELTWTTDLGQAFLDQPKEVMDMIQALRAKAQTLGTLKTSPEQTVVVTNIVVVQTNVTQVVTVTNQVVQVYSSNPQVVYVPTYDPWYAYYPPPYYYTGPPPVVSFAVGVTVGLIIANNCDWHGGGIYVGHHGVAVWGGGGYHGHGDVDIDINRNVNINGDVNIGNGGSSKWQPDQNRLRSSGGPGARSSTHSAQSRGWSSGPTSAARTSSASAWSTPSSSFNRSSASPAASRPAVSPSASRNVPTTSSFSRPAASPSRESAFSSLSSGGSSRSFSSRGSSSRGGGGSRSFGGGRRR